MRRLSVKPVLLLVLLMATQLVAADMLTRQAVQNNLTQYAFIKGEFKQERMLQGISRPIRSSGRFMIWRGHGIYWETNQPLFQATTFLGNRVYYWPDENTPEIVKDGVLRINERISQLMLAFFTADFEQLERDFKADWQLGEKSWTVDLTPNGMFIGKAINRVSIQGEQHIERIDLKLATGDSTSIVLHVSATGDAPDGESRTKIEPNDPSGSEAG